MEEDGSELQQVFIAVFTSRTKESAVELKMILDLFSTCGVGRRDWLPDHLLSSTQPLVSRALGSLNTNTPLPILAERPCERR